MRHNRQNREEGLPGSVNREIAFDCRFFLGNRPCMWHKSTGALCTCEHYERVEQQILLIKLDAMGDVLRTTALLPALVEAHPGVAVTWVTRRESRPLLEQNPYISEILDYGPDALLQSQVRSFDRVINLDASKTSAALASMANGRQKHGFVLDVRGHVQPTHDAARKWLEMGLFDDLKRRNTRTYQDIMLEIIGLSGKSHRYIFELTGEERAHGRANLERLGVDFSRQVIGLSTGAGRRWELKRWRGDAYLELAERVAKKHHAQCVLLGGPEERERHKELLSASRVPLIDSGCDNPVRHFAAIVAACNVVVTGDTLAMHLALAQGCRVVALFGPTSAAEIEMYGLGEKIVPRMDCLACYKSACDFVPNCMDLITTGVVEAAVERQLKALSADLLFVPDYFVPKTKGHQEAQSRPIGSCPTGVAGGRCAD